MKSKLLLSRRQFLMATAVAATTAPVFNVESGPWPVPSPEIPQLVGAKPLFYNYDAWNTFLLGADDPSIQGNFEFLFQTGVTTLMLSPSVGQAFICRPGTTLEMCHRGIPPSSADLDTFTSQCWAGGRVYLEAAAAVVRRWSLEGVDPYEVALSRAKDLGLRVVISLRLNDVHTLASCPSGPYSDEFYRNHQDWRVPGYQTLDFSHAEVRQRRVDQIQELVSRYAVADGVELDFVRGAPYFSDGDPASQVSLMTDFVSQVATVSANVGKSRGRPLGVSVIVPSSLANCLEYRVDPLTWARNGYIDAITLKRFLRLTADLDIEAFKERAPGVPIYGCLEFLISSGAGFTPQRPATTETYRGLAAALYARGADGMYLYNMYAGRTAGAPMTAHFEPVAVLNHLAVPKVLTRTNCLFLATRKDSVDQGDETRPDVTLPAAQLAQDAPLEAEIYVGAPSSSSSFTLRIIGANLASATLSVEVNGHPLGPQAAGTTPTLFPELYNGLAPAVADCVDFQVPVWFLFAGRNAVVLHAHSGTSSGSIDVETIELASYAPQEVTPEMLAVATTSENVRVGFSGLGGLRYRVERSTDLRNWLTLTTITMPFDGIYTYFDSAPPQVAAFYRALSELAPEPLPSGAVAWWHAQDTAGDAIGGNNGSLEGGATFTNGKVGRAFLFNGTSGFITIANNGSMDFGVGDFTIEGWCRFDSFATDGEILHKVTGTVPSDQTYFLEFSAIPGQPSLRFMVRNTDANQNDLVVPVSLVLGLWYHVAAVRATNMNSLYLDGALIGSQIEGASVDTGAGGNARIGNIAPNGVSGQARFFAGAIDELSLYNRALSSSEISAIYDADSAGKSV